MKKKAIYLIDTSFVRTNLACLDYVYSAEIKDRINEISEVYQIPIGRNNFIEHLEILKNAEVAFSTWGMPKFTTKEIYEYMPNLKILFYAAGSVQAFARSFINAGVKVVSAWAANAVPVAEYSVSQILLANKGFYQCLRMTKEDYYGSSSYFRTFPGNYNVKIGILGAGMIGTKVIELLTPCALEVLVYDPFLSQERAEGMKVKRASLEEIFSTCQTISNHIADLPETFGILNEKYFKCMLPNATFINTGRGSQVVENDLAEALRIFPSRTAVLDVTIQEPLEKNNELLKLPNVFLTPHIAGSSGNEVGRMAQYMVEEFIRYENNEELKYNITLKMLETMA